MRGTSASTAAVFLGVAGLLLASAAPVEAPIVPPLPTESAEAAPAPPDPLPASADLDPSDPGDPMPPDAPDQDIADSEVLEPPSPAGTERRPVEVASGDTLLSLLAGADVPRAEAQAAVAALEEVFEPRRLRVGQEVTLLYDHRDRTGASAFAGLELMPDVESVVEVRRDPEGGYTANRSANELVTRTAAASAVITTSLIGAAGAAGVPDQVMLAVIRTYSHEVDFQRDIQPGDSFDILFEQDFHPSGEFARNGGVLYAVLTLSGTPMPIYRFEDRNGDIDFYDREGESIRRALLRTPVDGARLSSGFGMRRHPILGYSRMHRGVDFAAPTGTPVFAAGDGTVDVAGTNAGYGRYIRLRHNGTLATAYGHLSRYADGLKPGRKVRQGEVIGYVGSTGMSTGPHLHFEVLAGGEQVDPLSVDMRTGRRLEGRELAAFRRRVDELERRFAELAAEPQMAARPDRD